NYISELGGLQILEIEEINSYEKGNDSQWVHCLLKKEPLSSNHCKFCWENHTQAFPNVIFESLHCFAVKDNHPLNAGHILIISKNHYEHWFHAPDEIQKDILFVLNQVKDWIDKEYAPHGYNVGINCGV